MLTQRERWERYLFERHSREELAVWAPTLRHFRYWRAIGGPSGDDGDPLFVALRIADPPDAPERIAAALGVRTAGHTTLAGEPVFAWLGTDRLTLSLHDPDAPWDVTPRAIAGARRIEPLLDPVADLLIDPPRDDEHCITPQRYPELFGTRR